MKNALPSAGSDKIQSKKEKKSIQGK